MFDSKSNIDAVVDEAKDYLSDEVSITEEDFSLDGSISASLDLSFKSFTSFSDDELYREEQNSLQDLVTAKSPSFDLEENFSGIGKELSASRNSISQALFADNFNAGVNNESAFLETSPAAAVSTGDYRLDALLGGTKWSGNTITYSFFDGGSYYGTETAWEVSDTVKNNVRYILENYIEPLINVDFVEVSDAGSNYGQLRYMLSDGPDYAYARRPSNLAVAGDVHLNPYKDNAWTTDGFQGGLGTHGFETLMHETLHALGLKHPGNYNGSGTGEGPFLPYGEDNTTNTIMSYNDAGKSASTLMPYDIMALQSLYGASSYNAGNTTYTFDTVFGFNDGTRYWGSLTNQTKVAIWDGGGIDLLNFSKLGYSSSGYLFNLNEGGMITTRSSYNGTSYQARSDSSGTLYYTTTYGTALSYNVTIENAIGSSSNDAIIGNNANNILLGISGNDYLLGQGGNDSLLGGSGNDTLLGGSGNDTLTGGSGNDRLVGYSSGTEYDVLTGGTGVDTFVLGNSSNTFYQGNGYAKITDFNWLSDYIEVKGTSSQYSLGFGDWIGDSAQDTAIFYGNDAIGIVEDYTNVSITRDFLFV